MSLSPPRFRRGHDPSLLHRQPGLRPVSAAGQLVSAATLGRFTGLSSASRARRSGIPGTAGHGCGRRRDRGGLAGRIRVPDRGLTTDRAADDDRTVALHRRAFLAGGVAHAVGYGLLVGALGVAGERTGCCRAAWPGRAGLGRGGLAGTALPGRRTRRLVHPRRPVLRTCGAERGRGPDGRAVGAESRGAGDRARSLGPRLWAAHRRDRWKMVLRSGAARGPITGAGRAESRAPMGRTAQGSE